MQFSFENTKHKLGIKIWGSRKTFHELHELLMECWDCEDAKMSQAEACSYIGVISFFSYEVRHAFMGDRLVKLDGKLVKNWKRETFQLFEEEMDRFEVGMELSWPHILCIMASWWECFKHQDCPVAVVGIMREFTRNIEQLLQMRSKVHYPNIEPYIHGAIYTANPYLMHFMEHTNVNILRLSSICSITVKELAEEMKRVAYGTPPYDKCLNMLKQQAKKLDCPIEEIRPATDEKVYEVEL